MIRPLQGGAMSTQDQEHRITRHGLIHMTLGVLMIVWAGNWILFSLLRPGNGLSPALAIAILGYGLLLLISGIRFSAVADSPSATDSTLDEEG